MKKRLASLIAGSVILLGGANAPVIPVTLHVVSLQTSNILDTPSGKLDKGFYTVDPSGEITYAEPSATSTDSVFDKVVTVIPKGAIRATVLKTQYTKICEDVDASLFVQSDDSPDCSGLLSPLEGLAGIAHAAVAFGSTSTETFSNNSLTVTIATGPTVSGVNTIGIAELLIQTNLTVSGVTWGGAAMTFVGGKTEANNGVERLETWIIVNPTSGATITATRTGATNVFGLRATYMTGAKQSTAVDNVAVAEANPGTTNLACSVAVNTANSWTLLQSRSDAASQTAVSGVTLRDVYNQQAHWDSNGALGTGSNTMTVTDGTAGAGDQWCVITSLAPFSANSNMLPGMTF